MKTIPIPVDERSGKPMVTSAMKAEHIGEYTVPVTLACTECPSDGECPVCDGSGEYIFEAPVPWTTCKQIYKDMAVSASKECA